MLPFVADTEWGTNPSYLVRLRDTLNLLPPLDRSVFFSEPFSARLKSLIDAGVKNLFYNREPALNQGAYLTPAPTDLVRILDDAYKVAANKSLAELVPEIAELPSIRGANSWIFQANPDLYEVRAALHALTKQTWLVSKFKDEMKLGERVYLWESGLDGGIVGIAELVGLPAIGPALKEESPFAKDSEKFQGEYLRATLHVLTIRVTVDYLSGEGDYSLSISWMTARSNYS